MISIRCPHCRVGLKVDETRIPEGLEAFKCPKCKHEIPMLYLRDKLEKDVETDTHVVNPNANGLEIGHLTVLKGDDAPQQEYPLYEGVIIVGRRAKTSTANICIQTSDKTMSRNHLRIEVKKLENGGYVHYLSDNNSKNKTLYNGAYMARGDVVVLRDKDEIVIGRTVLRFNI